MNQSNISAVIEDLIFEHENLTGHEVSVYFVSNVMTYASCDGCPAHWNGDSK